MFANHEIGAACPESGRWRRRCALAGGKTVPTRPVLQVSEADRVRETRDEFVFWAAPSGDSMLELGERERAIPTGGLVARHARRKPAKLVGNAPIASVPVIEGVGA